MPLIDKTLINAAGEVRSQDFEQANNVDIHKTGNFRFPEFTTVGITDGLNSFIPLNESIIRDLSGSGFTTTVSGSPTFNGDHYRFDGVDDQIDTLNNSVSDWNTPFTLMVSIRIPTEYDRQVTAQTAIIGRGSYTGSVGLTLASTNSFNFFLRTNSGITEAGIGVFDRDTWYHLVATWDGGTTMRAYRDGVLITENTVTDSKEGVPGGTTWLITPSMAFSGSSGERLLADMRNVKIFNRALTTKEVKLEYNTMFNNEVQVEKVTGTLFAKDLINFEE